MNKKIITISIFILLLAVSMPLMAQEHDYINLNEYDLDLTVEQINILEDELSAIVDISGEIDLEMIKIILGELEENEDFSEASDNAKMNQKNNPGKGNGKSKNNPGKGN